MRERSTMGLTLLSADGWDAPKARGARAQEILQKIFRNSNGVSLGSAISDKSFAELYLSDSTFAAANNLVDTVGAVNVAVATCRSGVRNEAFKLLWETLPFAAMLVSHLFSGR